MRNVLFTALIAAVSTTVWAQAPEPKPAPATPTRVAAQAVPATPAPPATAAAGARQAAPPAPAVPATAPAPAPGFIAVQTSRYPNPPRNVRFEIVITETGGAKPSTKTVSLTVNDGGGIGSVRNSAKATGDRWLNVDVRGVQAFEGGAVRAAINVEYQPYTPDEQAPTGGIQSSITSMFLDARRTQILQTTDPISDRRTTIDVTMTVLK